MKHELSSKKLNLQNISLVALLFIIVGMAINIGGSIFNPEYVGNGNYFIGWGFIIAVIGLFIHFLKQKM